MHTQDLPSLLGVPLVKAPSGRGWGVQLQDPGWGNRWRFGVDGKDFSWHGGKVLHLLHNIPLSHNSGDRMLLLQVAGNPIIALIQRSFLGKLQTERRKHPYLVARDPQQSAQGHHSTH